MWMMMIISYVAVAYIDTRAFTALKEKGIAPLYIILMAISWAIGISGPGFRSMLSPAEPIKNLIISILGG